MKRTLLRGLLITALVSIPVLVVAQTLIPEGGTIGSCNFTTGEIHFDCIPMYVGYLVKTLFGLVGGFALMEIIKAGYQLTISGFGTDKTAAYHRLQWALIGLAFSVFSFLIVDVIISVLLGT